MTFVVSLRGWIRRRRGSWRSKPAVGRGKEINAAPGIAVAQRLGTKEAAFRGLLRYSRRAGRAVSPSQADQFLIISIPGHAAIVADLIVVCRAGHSSPATSGDDLRLRRRRMLAFVESG